MIDGIRDHIRASILEQASVIGKMRYYFFDRHYTLTIRVLLIIVCFSVTLTSTLLLRESAVTGNFLKGLIPVGAMAGLIVLMFVYSNMELTAIVLFFVTLMLADGVGTGTGTKITFTFLGVNLWAALWLFKMAVVDRKFNFRPAPVNKPILIFVITVLLSFLWGNWFVDVPVSGIYYEKIFPRLMTFIVLVVSPFTVIMYGNHIRSIGTLKLLVYVFLICGLVYGIMRIAGNVPTILNIRGQFPIWVSAFALGQMLLNTRLPWVVRIACGAIVGIWYYIQLGLGLSWLSGWLPLTMVVGIMLFIHSKKLLLVGLMIAGAYVLINLSGLQENFAREDEESGGTRQAAWSEALKVAEKHLLLGTGPAGYAFYYMTYGFKANFSHNNYVDIIAQTGAVGFTAFIGMWLSFGWTAWKMWRYTPNSDGFVQGLKLALLACWPTTMVIMMLGDWLTPFTYTQGLGGIDYAIWGWMIPGWTLALYHISGGYAAEQAEKAARKIQISEEDTPQLPPPTQTKQRRQLLNPGIGE